MLPWRCIRRNEVWRVTCWQNEAVKVNLVENVWEHIWTETNGWGRGARLVSWQPPAETPTPRSTLLFPPFLWAAWLWADVCAEHIWSVSDKFRLKWGGFFNSRWTAEILHYLLNTNTCSTPQNTIWQIICSAGLVDANPASSICLQVQIKTRKIKGKESDSSTATELRYLQVDCMEEKLSTNSLSVVSLWTGVLLHGVPVHQCLFHKCPFPPVSQLVFLSPVTFVQHFPCPQYSCLPVSLSSISFSTCVSVHQYLCPPVSRGWTIKKE